ncbi:LamG domain-containing protein [Pyxidicoccus xibeiensis]|uniref:LamG domain-containing protein n=1 Tax=Pyxidicoccus xibeiensis TaxID=2906759 RepID=UPI0020A7F8BE|nr:LamG domain-containing protein [Pyxidicoccus xibeiensis]MCP3136329.1 LamG domain-containing protein [Pyxidicoccus xibeiensis]
MARAFDITTPSPMLKLDGSRRGEVGFTVTNSLGQPVQGRATVVPEGATPPEWFSLAGEAERDFPRDGTHVFHVRVAVPPSQAVGEHAFRLLVVDQANPDEHFADGPLVAFKVTAPSVIARRRFPWWIPASAAAAVLIMVLVGVLLARRGQDEGTGGSGQQAQPQAMVLAFDGSSTYVDLGEPPALEVTGPITLEAWIRPTSSEGLQNIVSLGYVPSPNGGGVVLGIVSGYYQARSNMDGKGSGFALASIPAQDLDQWVHLAAVHDGDKWRLYRNGELLAEASHPGGGVFPLDARWAIGAKGSGGERFFKGNIRDVRIWRVARTPEQLREGMSHPPDENAKGLAGYWPLDEGQGNNVQDHSGNEAHGFIQGLEQWTPDAPPQAGAPTSPP